MQPTFAERVDALVAASEPRDQEFDDCLQLARSGTVTSREDAAAEMGIKGKTVMDKQQKLLSRANGTRKCGRQRRDSSEREGCRRSTSH
jgi:hypothetical protein